MRIAVLSDLVDSLDLRLRECIDMSALSLTDLSRRIST